MNIGDDIKKYLEAQSVVGSGTAWACVLDFMLDQPDKLVCVSRTGGFPAHRRTGQRTPTIQVRVRAGKGEEADALTQLESIYTTLNGIANQQVNSQYVREIRAMSEVLHLGRDDADRSEYSQNYQVEAV